MGFYEDDWYTHTSGQPVKTVIDPLKALLRAVFVGPGCESLSTADDEGANKAAVDDTFSLAEDYFEDGILLVKHVDCSEGFVLRNE